MVALVWFNHHVLNQRKVQIRPTSIWWCRAKRAAPTSRWTVRPSPDLFAAPPRGPGPGQWGHRRPCFRLGARLGAMVQDILNVFVIMIYHDRLLAGALKISEFKKSRASYHPVRALVRFNPYIPRIWRLLSTYKAKSNIPGRFTVNEQHDKVGLVLSRKMRLLQALNPHTRFFFGESDVITCDPLIRDLETLFPVTTSIWLL